MTSYSINFIFLSGASGIGELLANTLAVRNINVIVLDVNPIITENCTRGYSNRWIQGTDVTLQTISHILNVMSPSSKKLKLCRRGLLKRCVYNSGICAKPNPALDWRADGPC